MDVLRVLSRSRRRTALFALMAFLVAIAAVVLLWNDGKGPPTREFTHSQHLQRSLSLHNVTVADYLSTTGSSIPSNERVTSTLTVRQGSISVSPASPTAGPEVSQEAAVEAWLNTGVLPGTADNTQPSFVLYGNLTDTDYSTIQSTGTTTPDYTQYPVWVIEYANAVVPLEGGYDPSANPSTRPTSSTGSLYVFIDAATGSYLFASSQTVPTAP